MMRVCIVCEGPTEVEFIKSCVTPYLWERGVVAYPAILQAPSGRHRGGRVTVERLAKFMTHQIHEADRMTTLVDFYGFQDRANRSKQEIERAILDAVMQLAPKTSAHHVLPYVQMHEFEALLFSEVEQFQFVLDGWNDQSRAALQRVRSMYASPEDINDSPQTAPSKRILAIFENGSYSKTEHGPLIAEAIGIEAIRAQCPQFDAWLTKLEAWGN